MKAINFPRNHTLPSAIIHLFHCWFSDSTAVNNSHATGLHACKGNSDEDPMPKQRPKPIKEMMSSRFTIQNRWSSNLWYAQRLFAWAQPTLMVSSFIARYSPSKQCVLSIPPLPVLLCQMTNTPYQGSELADVSNCEQGSNLISSLIFAGIFNRHAIPNQDNRYGHFSSSTTSLSLGSP